jgi:hypothetical protein
MLVNSAADWGVSDPLKVPKTARALKEAGVSEAAIETVCWKNPVAFFAQSGRFDAAELERSVGIDQTRLWEGNSVLRGQTPITNTKP